MVMSMDPWVWSLASQRKVTRLTVPIRYGEMNMVCCVYAYTTAIFPISIHALPLTPCSVIASTHSTHTISDGTRMLSESSIHPTCVSMDVCVCGWKSTASFNLAELIVLCFSLLLHMTKCVMCIERHCTHTHTHRHLLGLPYIYVCTVLMCVASFSRSDDAWNGTIKS